MAQIFKEWIYAADFYQDPLRDFWTMEEMQNEY